MKHIKLFEEFTSKEVLIKITESAISTYPPGNPFHSEGGVRWIDVARYTKDLVEKGQSFTLNTMFDYDFYTLDPRFRSKVQDTWEKKDLPLFSEKFPRYSESEFDLVETLAVDEPGEPRLKIVDFKGNLFLIPCHKVIEIVKGSSVRDGIISGSHYIIDGERCTIENYINGEVIVRTGDRSVKKFTLKEWNAAGYTATDD